MLLLLWKDSPLGSVLHGQPQLMLDVSKLVQDVSIPNEPVQGIARMLGVEPGSLIFADAGDESVPVRLQLMMALARDAPGAASYA